MSERTFAREAILRRIYEKAEWKTNYQGCYNHDKITAYHELHGDYSEYC